MATKEQVLDELNQAISDLNAKRNKLENYLDDWATLPAGVKTAVRSNVVSYMTTLKTNIDTFITHVNSL